MSVQGNSSEDEVIVSVPTDRPKCKSSDPSSEGMFEVESIIDKRETADGTVRYLIKWKGYEESESTWEPKENLGESCNHLVSRFEYNYATKRIMNKRSSEEAQNPEIAEKKVCKTARKKLSALIDNDNRKPSSSAARGNAGDSDDIEILIPKIEIPGVMGSSKSINENSKLGDSSAGVTSGGFTPFTAVMGESSKVLKGNVCGLAGKRNKEAPQSCPSTPMTTEIPGEIEFLEEICTIGETETPETASPTILARGKVNGRRTFFLKFPNTGNVVMMPVEEAKIKWPQAILEFYEMKYELLCRFVPEQEY